MAYARARRTQHAHAHATRTHMHMHQRPRPRLLLTPLLCTWAPQNPLSFPSFAALLSHDRCAVLDVVLANKGRDAFSTIEIVDAINKASNSSDTDSLVLDDNVRARGLEWTKQNLPAFWPYGPSTDIVWPTQWNERTWYQEHNLQQEEVRGLKARGECLKGPAFKSVQKRSTQVS